MKTRNFFYLLFYGFVLLLISVIFFPPTPAQAQWAGQTFHLKFVFYANYQQVWGDNKPTPNYTVKVKLTDGQNHELSCNTTPYGRPQTGADGLRGEVPREVLNQTRLGQDLLKNPYPWGACIITWPRPDKIYPYYYPSWTIENLNRWYDFQTKTTPRSFINAIPVQTLSYAGSTANNPQTNLLTKCSKLRLAVPIAYGPAGSCKPGSQKSLGSYYVGASETTGSGGGGTQTFWSEVSQTASTIYVHYYFNLDPTGADEKMYPGAISPEQAYWVYLKHLKSKKLEDKQLVDTMKFLSESFFFTLASPDRRKEFLEQDYVKFNIPLAARQFLLEFESQSLIVINAVKVSTGESKNFFETNGQRLFNFWAWLLELNDRSRTWSQQTAIYLRDYSAAQQDPGALAAVFNTYPPAAVARGLVQPWFNGWRLQYLPALQATQPVVDKVAVVADCVRKVCQKGAGMATRLVAKVPKIIQDLSNQFLDFGDPQPVRLGVQYFRSYGAIGTGRRMVSQTTDEIIRQELASATKYILGRLKVANRHYKFGRTFSEKEFNKMVQVVVVEPTDQGYTKEQLTQMFKGLIPVPKTGDGNKEYAASIFREQPHVAAFSRVWTVFDEQSPNGKNVAYIFINKAMYRDARAVQRANISQVIYKELLDVFSAAVSKALEDPRVPPPTFSPLMYASRFEETTDKNLFPWLRVGSSLLTAEKLSLSGKKNTLLAYDYAWARQSFIQLHKMIKSFDPAKAEELLYRSQFDYTKSGFSVYRDYLVNRAKDIGAQLNDRELPSKIGLLADEYNQLSNKRISNATFYLDLLHSSKKPSQKLTAREWAVLQRQINRDLKILKDRFDELNKLLDTAAKEIVDRLQ